VLGVEKTAVGSRADLVNNVRLEIAVDRARNVFPVSYASPPSALDRNNDAYVAGLCTSLRKEGAEAMVGISGLALFREVSIGLKLIQVSKEEA